MRIVVLTLLTLVASLMGLANPPVSSASTDCSTSSTTGVSVGTNGGGFTEAGDHAVEANCDSPGTVPTVDIPGEWHDEVACVLGGEDTCLEPARCVDGSIMHNVWFQTLDDQILYAATSCPDEAGTSPPVQITNAMIARAFRRIPLPESRLVVQPPGGETLVNFETNFYTEAEPFERSVRLVGQRIDLKIWPSSFGWSFGDGVESRTEEPGSAYPDLEITHAYREAGRVGPSVDTTYSAEFRVNGGAWRPVVGTVTMEGAPVGLQVRTATPTLVGYR